VEYRDILVHVPLQGYEVQVNVAVALAKEFGSHLTGLRSLRETTLLKEAVQNPFIHLDESTVSGAIDKERDEALSAQRWFHAAAENEGISASWQAAEGDPADLMIHACRLQDLAIVEQCSNGSELLWGPAVQVALSGFPTLVIPRSWRGPLFLERAVVAWNGSAQSAAAVRHALPILIRARHVTLLIGTSREIPVASMQAPPLDIEGYLRRHRVEFTSSDLQRDDADAGSAIIEAVEGTGADLIVMGAYGRSKIREWLLGGATRQILEYSRAPTFMVH
jgi:nucleotide-binding universal stress UspA family protein